MREQEDGVLRDFLALTAGKPLRVVGKETGIAFSTIGRMRRGEDWDYTYAIRLKMRKALGLLRPDEQDALTALQCPRLPRGWQCPVCDVVYAPWVERCAQHDSSKPTTPEVP